MIPFLLVATTVAAAPRRKPKRVKPPAAAVAPDRDERGEADRYDLAALDVEDEEDDDEAADDADVEVRASAKARRRAVGTEWYFRAGLAHVEPRISSSGMELQPEGITRLATPMEPVQGGVESSPTNVYAAILGVAPAALGGYVGFETIIAVPKKAKLRAYGDLADKSLAPTALDLVPTGIPPLGEELGEAMAAPVTLTAVVRTPALGPVRAYAGGGASVLFVMDAKVTNQVLTEVATPKLEIDPAFGVVAQAGVDVHLFGKFYARLDYKAMWFQPAETRITNIHVRTTIPLLETVDVGSARSESTANPRIVQIGIGASL